MQSAAAVAAALCVAIPLLLPQLLLIVIVCRIAQIVACSLRLIPSSVFFLFIQARFIFNVCTPGNTVAFTASNCLYYVYPR